MGPGHVWRSWEEGHTVGQSQAKSRDQGGKRPPSWLAESGPWTQQPSPRVQVGLVTEGPG